jgi:hypothetical protein
MQALRAELTRGMSGALRLASRVLPVPPLRPDLLTLAARALPPPLATRLAQLLRQVPPGQVEAVMRLPLVRRALLEAIFWQLPLYLDASRAGRSPLSMRWQLAGRGDDLLDVYDVVVSDGRVRCIRGGGEPPPRLAVTVDPLELLRIAGGTSDPVSAYLAGRLSVRGDLLAMARFGAILRLPATGARGPAR